MNEKKIKIENDHEILSLINDITFSSVPYWYGASMRDLHMSIIAPKERENHPACPLIIWVCGGAFRVVDRAVWLPEMMYFAERGYIVAGIEYRTSNDTMFPHPLIDVKSAIRYLKAHASQYCIDPERVCIMGESAGGTMASLAGVTGNMTELDQGDYLHVSSRVNAVVDFYGLVDLINLDTSQGTQEVPPYVLQDFLGLGYGEETARKASAAFLAGEDAPPFLILHGEKDTVVPLAQSLNFYETLRKKGADAEMYVIEDAGHGDPKFYQMGTKRIIEEFLKRVFSSGRN